MSGPVDVVGPIVTSRLSLGGRESFRFCSSDLPSVAVFSFLESIFFSISHGTPERLLRKPIETIFVDQQNGPFDKGELPSCNFAALTRWNLIQTSFEPNPKWHGLLLAILPEIPTLADRWFASKPKIDENVAVFAWGKGTSEFSA